jgi:hypothetical protein
MKQANALPVSGNKQILIAGFMKHESLCGAFGSNLSVGRSNNFSLDNNCPKWSVGIRFVEWHMNTSYSEAIGMEPFKAMFGQSARQGLKSKLPQAFLDRISNGILEDLEEMLHEQNEADETSQNSAAEPNAATDLDSDTERNAAAELDSDAEQDAAAELDSDAERDATAEPESVAERDATAEHESVAEHDSDAERDAERNATAELDSDAE